MNDTLIFNIIITPLYETHFDYLVFANDRDEAIGKVREDFHGNSYSYIFDRENIEDYIYCEQIEAYMH